MRTWDNGTIECYKKEKISAKDILRPFLVQFCVAKEISFNDFTFAKIKETRNVERYKLRFETYEWHLKKIHLNIGAFLYTAEIEFLDITKVTSLSQAYHVISEVLIRCQNILLTFEVRHLLSSLLGTTVETEAEIALFAPKRPINLTRSIINNITSSVNSWLVAPKHDGLYTLLLCCQSITIIINDSIAQIFFRGRPITLADLLKHNYKEKILWYIFAIIYKKYIFCCILLYISCMRGNYAQININRN